MKKTLSLIFLAFITNQLSSNENWIEIKPINQAQTKKSIINQELNLSQIEPVNKIMKNASLIKQLIDATSKKEEPKNDKKWFLLKSETSK
jgi:hypothetical protein